MGMFDTIQWGDKLPFSEEMREFGLDKNNWSFQTKDLDCCLANYVVQDGKSQELSGPYGFARTYGKIS